MNGEIPTTDPQLATKSPRYPYIFELVRFDGSTFDIQKDCTFNGLTRVKNNLRRKYKVRSVRAVDLAEK